MAIFISAPLASASVALVSNQLVKALKLLMLSLAANRPSMACGGRARQAGGGQAGRGAHSGRAAAWAHAQRACGMPLRRPPGWHMQPARPPCMCLHRLSHQPRQMVAAHPHGGNCRVIVERIVAVAVGIAHAIQQLAVKVELARPAAVQGRAPRRAACERQQSTLHTGLRLRGPAGCSRRRRAHRGRVELKGSPLGQSFEMPISTAQSSLYALRLLGSRLR